MNHKLDAAFDGTAALAAIAAPLWLADAELWGRALVILGGVVLLALRIVMAWRALRHARNGGGRHE
ncbi:MAG TPA: hypothetical protein VNF99_19655 [Stellaceae bacterium]|nr:hypothetical protein [Stellaceae bacterium]